MSTPPRVIEVQSLSKAPNHAIIKLPGRAFPGTVVQGDSLHILLQLAREVRWHARRSGDAESIENAEELHDLLQRRLLHYQSVLLAAGSSLPYGSPVQEDT